MKPYFYSNQLAGLLLLIVMLGWAAIELTHSRRQREDATRVSGAGGRLAFRVCLIAAVATFYLAPRLVPAAAIRPGAAAFTVGMVIVLAGVAVRGWSFKTLGKYFTFNVMVSADQPVVTAGPYRVLRHPSYTAILLVCTGVGLASANWAGALAMTPLPLAAILRRIHIEEQALTATLGDRYRCYASSHKRLIPFVW